MRSVKIEGLLAQVELETTVPARVVAVITREAAEARARAGPGCHRAREGDVRDGRAVRWLFALAFVGAALVAGCGDDDGSGSELEELTVFAAASLTESFQQLAPDVRFNFAGSDELAADPRGRPGGRLRGGQPRYPDELFDEDLIESRRSSPPTGSCSSCPLTTRRGSSPSKTSARGEARRRRGGRSRGRLHAHGAGEHGRHRRPRQRESTRTTSRAWSEKWRPAKPTPAVVTDYNAARDELDAIELPQDAQAVVEYPIAVVSDTENREAAHAFVELVLSDEGQQALEDAGFGLP